MSYFIFFKIEIEKMKIFNNISSKSVNYLDKYIELLIYICKYLNQYYSHFKKKLPKLKFCLNN